jgi:PAS domain S-box-containing protein
LETSQEAPDAAASGIRSRPERSAVACPPEPAPHHEGARAGGRRAAGRAGAGSPARSRRSAQPSSRGPDRDPARAPDRPREQEIGARPGRVRLIAALLLLAAPLAVAAWQLGNYSAERERSNADARLATSLGSAVDAYRNVLAQVGATASRRASDRNVQRELLRGGARTLTWRLHLYPHAHTTRRPGNAPADAAARSVDVNDSKGHRVGRVVVFVPLDRPLVRWLTGKSDLGARQQLGLARGGDLVGADRTLPIRAQIPSSGGNDIEAGGIRYRAVEEDLGSAEPIKLVALERSSTIDSAANAARWRVMGLGFGLIAALLAMAYVVAPAIARSRVSRQERDQAERVLSRVGDGVFLVDRDGVIRLWNPAAEAITGLRADAVCGRPAQETIPGWAEIKARVPVASRPGDVDDASGAETVPLDVDGRELWLSFVGVTLADGTVYAFRDVTRERRLEEFRSEFVATISHELRTPLASLHGAAVTLREREGDLSGQTVHALLDMIAVQSRRLANLVEEILVAGQLDSGSLRVVTQPFDPEELVWTAAAAARLRVGNDTTIDVSLPAVVPKVAGDAERTRQVLTNLVDNAIKYSPHGGRIELGVEVDDDHARFTVRDEGMGIPLGEQQRIFDKFYRLDPDQRRGIGGSGLGLYICRELVRSMNGRIWVESDPGKGATFTFELPIAERITATA